MPGKILSTDSASLALSKVKRFNKFEIVYLAFLHGYTANPKYADALPEAIANLAYKGACAAIAKMAEARAGIYGLQDPGLEQIEIPFGLDDLPPSHFKDNPKYNGVPDPLQKICANCGRRRGVHRHRDLACPAIDDSGEIIDRTYVSNHWQPIK